jgi:hypothetical protein
MSEHVILYNWTSTSQCSPCFYGTSCQFTTSYYSISLDALFYTFLQSRQVVAGIIVIFLIATICNILSIITFCQKDSREMGNGIYRLWIAIVGQLGTIVVAIRLLLIFVKKSIEITNSFYLDYLISVLPALQYSLTGCVAIERTVVAYQSLSFDKYRSRYAAKIVIPALVVYHFLIALHELFQCHLVSSDLQFANRSWCSLYLNTRFLSTYKRTTNAVHLVLPFTLNLFAPIIMFIALTRHKATLKRNATTWSNFKDVLCTYKHNIINPSILFALMTPRLILTFHLNCITQSWQNTAYLVAYLISLVPLMTSLFIFVIPSPNFREEFLTMLQRTITYECGRQYQ